jgi:hypothetical protein
MIQRRRWLQGGLLGMLCLAALPVGAQAPAAAAPAAPPGPDIVVEGRREQAVRNFVLSMTDANSERQLGRWDREVCPVVVGIQPDQAAAMEAQIGAVAGRLKLKTGGKGCLTTMLVIVDNDASGVATMLAKRLPTVLRLDGLDRLNRFAHTSKPVRWISVTKPCGFEGCRLSGSRLRSSARPALEAMIVVLDGKQIGNFALSELADYVAFVALSNPPPRNDWPSTSIMAMFGSTRPQGALFHLTDNDLAFLSGLYTVPTDGLGQSQRSAIVRAMTRGGHSQH